MKKLIIAFAVLAVSVASAATYGITLNDPSVIKGTQLKPGDYKMDVKDNSVILVRGTLRVEVPVKLQTVEQKNDRTSIVYGHENGKHVVRSIQIKGTRTKLIFEEGAVQTGGGGQ